MKEEPALRPCIGCQLPLHTNYSEFTFCPSCSSQKEACMICGGDAEALQAPVAEHGSSDNGIDGQPGVAFSDACTADFYSGGAPAKPVGNETAGPVAQAPQTSMDLLDFTFWDPAPATAQPLT